MTLKTLWKSCCLPLALFFLSACASQTDIFPAVVTSAGETLAEFPNPISIAVDQTNSQIVVSNSNVDFFFEQGSLAVLAVDATNTTAPNLTASQVISAPNFSGELYLDATTNNLYVPFREASSGDASVDQISQYALTPGSLALTTNTTVSANPFGITGNASQIFVVSDDVLTTFNTSLGSPTTIDLTTAETAGILDTDSASVEYAAYDATGNRLFVSNPVGRMFVLDLNTNTLSQAINGPDSTRNLLISNDLLYALDAVTKSVWIFDTTQLAVASSTPSSVDDSTFLIATVSVGTNPNGMAIDSTNNRLYVGNTDDDTISVIDTLTFEEVARVSVHQDDISSSFLRDGEEPFALAIGTFNGVPYVFVAGFVGNSVVMIHGQTLQVVEVFPNNSL